MINAIQNSTAGSHVNRAWIEERVIENDEFYVDVYNQ